LLALSAASCAVTVMAQRSAMLSMERLPWTSRCANAAVAAVAYLRQFVSPSGLAVFYPYAPRGQSPWVVAASLALLLGITVAALAWRRSRPYLLVGWLWYLGMLVPVSGLVQVGAQTGADRYTYLPLIGLAIAVTWLTAEFAGKSPVRRWALGMAWLFALAILTVAAQRQASYWRNSDALWTHTLASTTNNALARYNYGQYLLDFGQTKAALVQLQEAVSIKPDFAEAHNELGNALTNDGQASAALVHFQRAVAIKPGLAAAQGNLGVALARDGRLDEAIEHFQKALNDNRDSAQAHDYLAGALATRGLTRLQTGKPSEAIDDFLRALEIQPNNAAAHNNLGVALLQTGKPREAIVHFQQALQIKPDYANARKNLELARAKQH